MSTRRLTHKTSTKTVIEALRAWRKSPAGTSMTWKEVAKATGLTATSLQRWHAGRSAPQNTAKRMPLVKFLNAQREANPPARSKPSRPQQHIRPLKAQKQEHGVRTLIRSIIREELRSIVREELLVQIGGA